MTRLKTENQRIPLFRVEEQEWFDRGSETDGERERKRLVFVTDFTGDILQRRPKPDPIVQEIIVRADVERKGILGVRPLGDRKARVGEI